MTYAKAPPIEAAPASPIWFSRSHNCVSDVFWLQIRHTYTLTMPIINTKKMNVYPNRKLVTYARPAPTPVAPASPILFSCSASVCKVLFWLQIKHKRALIMTHYQSEKIGWRQIKVGAKEMFLYVYDEQLTQMDQPIKQGELDT